GGGGGVAVEVGGARAAYRDDGVTRAKRRYFVELHIEQGKELEDAGLDIGIVTHIAGPASVTVSFKGPGGHAGGLMMRDRHDASLAAAELALDVEGLVKREGSSDTVGTVGSWQVSPNAVNSVPREVVLGIDVRDIDGPRLDRVVQGVKERAKVVAETRGVEYAVEVTNHDAPATSSGRVVEAVGAAAGALKLRSKKMVSRAYHDSLFMGLVSEMGMIFIPCEGGKSHRPDEFASERDVLHGTQTLALTMGQLGGLLGEDALRHDDQVGTRHSEL
ncbi:MAG: M20/M25/M40 family metallo-hydrolase, partial [bacterium]